MVYETTRVLLIEDDPDDMALIQRMFRKLEKPHFKLNVSKSLNEGLNELSSLEYHVLLLDLNLPDSAGFDTFIQVREQASKIPIIILTGLSDEELGVKAVREGAQDYLVKGEFDQKLLARSIDYAIERKRTEEALRESEEKYRNIVEAAQAGIWLIDTENKTSYINRRMSEMLGYKVNDMLGHKFFDFLNYQEKKKFKDQLKQLKQGKAGVNELQFNRKDGSDIWVLLSTSPLFDSNSRYIGTIGITTDITPRKEVEKLLIEKERYLAMITANIVDVVNYLIMEEDTLDA